MTNGLSFDTAIVIEKTSSWQGVAEEYLILERIYGPKNSAWKLIRQSLQMHSNKHFDVMDIELSNGEKKTVYFDISNFFGKDF